MNSVVEKLAAIEKEVAAIQPKMAPLTERIADLDQKVAGFAQQLTGIAEESAAVKQDIELTQQSLVRIQMLIGESKTESEQLVAGQEENLQRCETMTAVFGAAFQAVSQFFETAQRMGLADQAKAVFLAPSSAPATLTLPPMSAPVGSPTLPVSSVPPVSELSEQDPPSLPEQQMPEQQAIVTAEPVPPIPETETVAETVPSVPPVMESPVPESINEISPIDEILSVSEQILAESVVEETPIAESIPEEIVSESVIPEPPVMDIPNVEPPIMAVPAVDTPIAESPMMVTPVVDIPVAELSSVTEPPVLESPITESVLSESDFDTAVSDSVDKELASWSVPGLPDVAAPPEMASVDADVPSFTDTDTEPSNEMASHLDVSPLNLAVPALPEQNESGEMSETDEQAIEDMLATMMTPVTT